MVVLAAALAATFMLQKEHTDVEFEVFKKKFGKTYEASEETFRMTIFQENMKKIEEHNADKSQTYEMGVNQFTDMTQEEFVGKSGFIQKRC